MRRSAGPCRSVMVPTMISRSAWRGEKRGNSAPKRAMSYLLAAVAMNSIPQQAVTKGYWNSDHFRAQLTASASLPVMASNPMLLLPPDGALAPHVDQRHDEHGHEGQHAAQPEERNARRAHAVLQRPQARERLV